MDKPVLLIEDDPIIAWHLIVELEKINFTVLGVIESIKELEASTIHNYNHDNLIIIINLKLSEGWIPFVQLKAILSMYHSLVLLTGLADLELYSNELEGLDFLLLLKPFTIIQLTNILSFPPC